MPPSVVDRNNSSSSTPSVATLPSSSSTTTMKRVLAAKKSSSDIGSLEDFASYVPVRLNSYERGLLTVLESALKVSEYTDNVDVSIRRGNKARRILDGITEACNIATGLSVCGMQDQNSAFFSSSSSSPPMKSKKKKNKKEKKSSKKKKKSKKNSDLPDGTVVDAAAAEDGSSTNMSYTPRSLAGRSTKENAKFFQDLFEIGRRNKILNPAKMRDTYGKLMYLLQDAQSPNVAKSLGFSLHKDLVMVKPFLKSKAGQAGLDLLSDPRLATATAHITDRDPITGAKMPRETIQEEVRRKDEMKHTLVEEYYQASITKNGNKGSTNPGDSTDGPGSDEGNNVVRNLLTKEDLHRAIESIADAIAVVEQNLSAVNRTLKLLEDNFSPQYPEKPFSLQLSGSSYSVSSYTRFGLGGFSSSSSSSGGPTLSHSHSTQYTFVWQSLKLWCEVQRNMHRLWVCADDDLLSTKCGYSLWNTGQGLNRVQACPKVGNLMRNLLHKTQRATGGQWVGLSVIHLGDRDVPNALIFIDKYTQIPRFLKPLVDFVDGIPSMCECDDGFKRYVHSQFGSERNLQMTVLSDYFKHGFDGSGDDGGSCIDGRLTSSWNWTSRIAKKNYYHALMLSGFQGFDGDFK